MLFGLFKSKREKAAEARAAAWAIARRLSARFDAAQTTEDNTRHWANADALSADAGATPEIRATLRKRSRYEVANGGYANGMVKQKANDLIGTGPRLQMLTKNEATNEALEAQWRQWADATHLARTLRTATRCKIRDGEALGLITDNPALPTLAKVQLRLLEADRLTTPGLQPAPGRVDGIDFDQAGNPTRYWILDQHPGGNLASTNRATPYAARYVVHWFDPDRAEQHRGIPELTPSLALLANHRRFLRATIRAAETAAEIAAVLHTDQPPDENAELPEAMDTVALEFGAALVAPEGYGIQQVKAEHPTTTLAEYNEQIVAEEARPLLMPANVATGNSSKYNYASGRLDNQAYDLANAIDREDVRVVILEPLFDAWLRETLAAISGIAATDIDLTQYPHEFQWDTRGHVDPAKEANANNTDLRNGSLTFPTLYARSGRDWRHEFARQAEALGVTVADFQAAVFRNLFPAQPQAAPPEPPTPPADEPAEELDTADE